MKNTLNLPGQSKDSTWWKLLFKWNLGPKTMKDTFKISIAG